MASLTTKLQLRKPAASDNVDVVTDIADNMDKIDNAFAGIVGAFRNAIRNGDMGIAQRGSGPFSISGYGIDGWNHQVSGGTLSLSRVALTVGTETKHAAQATISGQSAAGDYVQFFQPIEGVEKYSGKQVTVSFDAFAAAGTPKIGVEVIQGFGTGGSPSAIVQTAISAVTISTTRTRYSVTFTVPSITGKTLGTDGVNYLTLMLWLSAGSTYAARSSSIGIQNSTITITDIQLEAGSVATAFERLPQQAQLAWCQRYFWRISWSSGNTYIANGYSYNTINSLFTVTFPVTMRVSPSMLLSSVGSLGVFNGAGGNVAVTNLALAGGGHPSRVLVESTVAAGLTAGQGSLIYFVSTGSLDFISEL